MKKTFLIILILYSIDVVAQKHLKKDSIYYLLDTTKIASTNNMWKTDIELPFKLYIIQCTCLKFGQKPTFFYNHNDQGQIISSKELKSIKQSSILELIDKAKQSDQKDFIAKNVMFLIEPIGKNYIVHRAGVAAPKKPEVINDYIYIDSLKSHNNN